MLHFSVRLRYVPSYFSSREYPPTHSSKGAPHGFINQSSAYECYRDHER